MIKEMIWNSFWGLKGFTESYPLKTKKRYITQTKHNDWEVWKGVTLHGHIDIIPTLVSVMTFSSVSTSTGVKMDSVSSASAPGMSVRFLSVARKTVVWFRADRSASRALGRSCSSETRFITGLVSSFRPLSLSVKSCRGGEREEGWEKETGRGSEGGGGGEREREREREGKRERYIYIYMRERERERERGGAPKHTSSQAWSASSDL